MWVLKPGRDSGIYDDLKRKIEIERDSDLFKARENAEGRLRRLFLQYYEEVPGDPPGSEPTYPLRGSTEWKKV